ncbi:glutathione S-transferase family protein [uncultured Roseovarius sp.]|uniref:glutathione S-transferase family protein n=1 Tax=uncultured Roseovarius sp. TaxID=293344 RepID=UPI0026316597|nr:glutathione S-transferase family protein [uncultured Roseovarius sp.]
MSGAGGTLTLTGYCDSVYTRSVRIALAEKGAFYQYVECNPFNTADALRVMQVHPFGRVPVLEDEGFRIYETPAILDYAEGLEGPSLVPADLRRAVRMRQVIALVDSYAYWPLVRQAFSHGAYLPLIGEETDAVELQAGLDAAPRVLDALEELATEGLVLNPGQVCLASCHLFPMLDYFAMVAEGREMLLMRDGLSAWMYWMGQRASVIGTRPVVANREGDAE